MNTQILKDWDVLADVQAIKEVLTEMFNDPDNAVEVSEMKQLKEADNG